MKNFGCQKAMIMRVEKHIAVAELSVLASDRNGQGRESQAVNV
jgi:hypothetical protein